MVQRCSISQPIEDLQGLNGLRNMVNRYGRNIMDRLCTWRSPMSKEKKRNQKSGDHTPYISDVRAVSNGSQATAVRVTEAGWKVTD